MISQKKCKNLIVIRLIQVRYYRYRENQVFIRFNKLKNLNIHPTTKERKKKLFTVKTPESFLQNSRIKKRDFFNFSPERLQTKSSNLYCLHRAARRTCPCFTRQYISIKFHFSFAFLYKNPECSAELVDTSGRWFKVSLWRFWLHTLTSKTIEINLLRMYLSSTTYHSKTNPD